MLQERLQFPDCQGTVEGLEAGEPARDERRREAAPGNVQVAAPRPRDVARLPAGAELNEVPGPIDKFLGPRSLPRRRKPVLRRRRGNRGAAMAHWRQQAGSPARRSDPRRGRSPGPVPGWGFQARGFTTSRSSRCASHSREAMSWREVAWSDWERTRQERMRAAGAMDRMRAAQAVPCPPTSLPSQGRATAASPSKERATHSMDAPARAGWLVSTPESTRAIVAPLPSEWGQLESSADSVSITALHRRGAGQEGR
jgi:hypothetical protein